MKPKLSNFLDNPFNLETPLANPMLMAFAIFEVRKFLINKQRNVNLAQIVFAKLKSAFGDYQNVPYMITFTIHN